MSEEPVPLKGVPSHYLIHCTPEGCGESWYLTEDQYEKQMMDASSTWKCPNCGGLYCEFDDDNFENFSSRKELVMNMTVYKYQFPIADEVHIEMPAGAKVLHVAEQHGSAGICLWALINKDAPTQKHLYNVYGTGYPMPEHVNADRHVATFFQENGKLVWHMFEVRS